MREILRGVLVALMLAAAFPVAADQAFDAKSWLEDLAQAKGAFATKHANLEWAHHLIIALGLSAIGSSVLSERAITNEVRGLDHVPIAVRDLATAEADFRKLGFVIKPGRFHADGLQNGHIKFADATDLELISPPATASDDLTKEYRRFLAAGDGPAFHGLYSTDLTRTVSRLRDLGAQPTQADELATFAVSNPLHALFFGTRLPSPTDRPEHFAHENTAFRLVGIWVAGADTELGLLRKFGFRPSAGDSCGPVRSTNDLRLPEGSIRFLPASAQLHGDRPIVGVTVAVRSLRAAAAVLTRNEIGFERPAQCRFPTLLVSPQHAHGMWLALSEQPIGK
jgi:hypothetical protein